MVYRVNNMVDITVRDLSRWSGFRRSYAVGRQRNAWLAHGSCAEARSLAAEDARKKAKHLASLHGVQIGPVLKISERGGGGQAPLVKAMAMAMDVRSVPISTGAQRLSAKIRVIYQLR